jgi:hypothetical protein
MRDALMMANVTLEGARIAGRVGAFGHRDPRRVLDRRGRDRRAEPPEAEISGRLRLPG